jgi:hypothetical protein
MKQAYTNRELSPPVAPLRHLASFWDSLDAPSRENLFVARAESQGIRPMIHLVTRYSANDSYFSAGEARHTLI